MPTNRGTILNRLLGRPDIVRKPIENSVDGIFDTPLRDRAFEPDIPGSPVSLSSLDPAGALAGDVVTLVGGIWVSGSLNAVQTIGAGGAAQTLDPNVYVAFLITLTAALTLTITPPTAAGQHTVTVETIQNVTGTWGTTWPASVHWADDATPSPTLTANTRTHYVLTTLDGGTRWLASMISTGVA